MEHGQHAGHAVAHGGIHHLPLAGRTRLDDGGKQANDKEQGAAAIVADEVERRHRLAVMRAERIQCTGDGDVVDVVAGGHRQRTFLAPAGHAGIDQARVALQRLVGAEAQPLHHLRPKPFDQRVGRCDQFHRLRDVFFLFQIELDRAAAAVHKIARVVFPLPGARDGHDVGAHVRQQHGRIRTRSDPGELDDAYAAQRSCGLVSAHAVLPSVLAECSCYELRLMT